MSDHLNSISLSEILCAALMCFILVGAANAVHAYTGEELAKDAKMSLPDARAIALKVHHGKIVDEELEKENGGSGLRYTFDIKDRLTTYEVGVDAKTGMVLESAAEGKNPD